MCLVNEWLRENYLVRQYLLHGVIDRKVTAEATVAHTLDQLRVRGPWQVLRYVAIDLVTLEEKLRHLRWCTGRLRYFGDRGIRELDLRYPGDIQLPVRVCVE